MHFDCDVLVAGSGAGGLAAAVTARKAGLDVVVAEKEAVFGGTTALSGGWLWIPNHPMQKDIGVADSMQDAATYLLHEAGEKYDPERVDAFLRAAPLAQPPFYAVRVEIGDLGTYAGIAANGHAQVLDEHKRPIPGLYAAGNDALSLMGGNYPGPGITLGPAMTFGWLAGRHLAGET